MVLEPNSEGMKRLTPAFTAASIRRSCFDRAREARVETTASWPSRADESESRLS